jgi:hypothetical protein
MTYESLIPSKYKDWKSVGRLVQGDIYENISFVQGVKSASELNLDDIRLRYAIVMTQDCDLASHQRAMDNGKIQNRAVLPTVLICPAYPIEQFFEGNHIESKDLGKFTDDKREKVMKNERQKRYHYIEKDIASGLQDVIIDFKHFYTISYDILLDSREKHYVTTVNELYRENLSQRFTNFLSRIGLPDET